MNALPLPLQVTLRTALNLLIFAVIGTALLAFTYNATNDNIANNGGHRNTSATAERRIRRLLLSLRYAATTQRQSGVEAKDSRVHFDMRRDF